MREGGRPEGVFVGDYATCVGPVCAPGEGVSVMWCEAGLWATVGDVQLSFGRAQALREVLGSQENQFPWSPGPCVSVSVVSVRRILSLPTETVSKTLVGRRIALQTSVYPSAR